MSQFTAQELEEFEFRQRAEQELAASKQTESAPPSPDAATEAVNQVMMGGAGAAVGAAAGPVINAGAKQAQRTSIAKQMGVNPADLEWDSAGQKWARKTGFGAGEGKTVQEVNEEFKRIQAEKNKPVGRGKIASKMTGPYNVEKAAELADAETARQARFAAQRQAEMDALKNQQTAAKAPRGFKSALTAPMGMLGRGAVGLGAGLQGSDALNRYNAGDTSGSVISGIGALGTAAAMIPHPVTRIGGTAIGLGAEGLNTFLDYLKKKSQKPAQPQPQQPQQMAEGGSAKNKMSKAERAAKAIRENNKKKVPQLADGGQVGMATPIDALPVKFGTEAPNSNPYGFTAPGMDPVKPNLPPLSGPLGNVGGQRLAGMQPMGSPDGVNPFSPERMEALRNDPKISEMIRVAGGGYDEQGRPVDGLGNVINQTRQPGQSLESGLSQLFNTFGNRANNNVTAPGQVGGEQGPVATANPYAGQPIGMSVMGGDRAPIPTTNAFKPVAQITPQQPFQQKRVASPLRGNINPSIAKRPLPYTPRPMPKPMPRKRFAEGGSTTPAWQRSEGKNPEGGLNAVGRASYNRETGGNLKAPQPEGGSRKKSFCARMGGMKKKLTSSKTANDPDSRINKALRKWKC